PVRGLSGVTGRANAEGVRKRLQRAALPVRANGTKRGCGDPDIARLLAEAGAVVDGIAVLVLPLVNHFVQQGVERFLPSVLFDVPVPDGDFGSTAARDGYGVVAQPGLHPAGHT